MSRLLGVAIVASMGLAACSSSSNNGNAGNSSASSQSAKTPVVIALDEDTTSAGSAYSIPPADGAKLAVKRINDAGGILGHPIKLVEVNSEGSATKGPTVLQKAIGEGAVSIILTASSSANIPMKPILQESHVVAIAPTSSNADWVKQPNADYVYAVAPFSSTWPSYYCPSLKKLGLSKVAVLTEESPPFKALTDFIVNSGIANCATVVSNQTVPATATDVTAQIVKAKSDGADALLIDTSGGALETLINNTATQLIPNIQRYTVATLANQPKQWKNAAPGALKGVLALANIDPSNPRTKALDEYYKKTNGPDSILTGFVAMGYDSVYLLKAAMEKAGTVTDGAAINQAMQTITDFEPTWGGTGLRLSFTATKHDAPVGTCGYFLSQFDAQNHLGGPPSGSTTSC